MEKDTTWVKREDGRIKTGLIIEKDGMYYVCELKVATKDAILADMYVKKIAGIN